MRYFMSSISIIGWTSLIVSIYLTVGLIEGTVRVVVLFVGTIFDGTKVRSCYIMDIITFEVLTHDY